MRRLTQNISTINHQFSSKCVYVCVSCMCMFEWCVHMCMWIRVRVCVYAHVCVRVFAFFMCVHLCVCVCAYVLVSKRTTRKLEKVVFADCLFPSRLIRRLSEGAWIASCRTMRPCLRIKKNDVISCECNGTVPIGQQRTRECEREREVIM